MAGYNWFLMDAARNLLLLQGITTPTPEQQQMAERVITSTRGYVRSLLPNERR